MPAVAAVISVGMLLVALFGPWFAPIDPAAQNLANTSVGPNGEHWLGTDALGRDIFSRLLVGGRTALLGPAAVAIGVCLIATTLGLGAGYFGGLVDAVITRAADLVYALPGLLVLIVFVGALGGSYVLALGTLVVFMIPVPLRMVRSAAIAQRHLAYIEAARTLGLGRTRVMARHILPNILPTVLASFLLDFVIAIISLSGLSFLGLGVQAGTPDWGLMIAENRSLLGVNSAAVVAPALLIMVAAASFTVLGDWLYDRMSSRGLGGERR